MSIWKIHWTPKQLNALSQNTIHTALGITFTFVGDDFLEATMPVDARTQRIFGFLHGGASVVLAESLGSAASSLAVGLQTSDPLSQAGCMGIEINASHLSQPKSQFVTGRATPIRLGRSLHVWDIQIRDGEDPKRLICQSRLTVRIQVSPDKPTS